MLRSDFVRHLVVLLCAAFACGGVSFLQSLNAQQPKREAVQDFMRAKLDASKSTLEGLVLEDFDEIGKQSVRLLAMSRRAEWNAIEGKVYQQLSSEFRSSVTQLGTAAKEKNLDKASLAYVQMTIRCLDCHKVIRGAKLAAAGSLPGDIDVSQEFGRLFRQHGVDGHAAAQLEARGG
ncbi:MAG: hypothetical protein HZA46_17275 [Planctomycetales bacterium]|nr:hypothetical protein [Planctomycetales bacterium]